MYENEYETKMMNWSTQTQISLIGQLPKLN